MSDVAHLDPLEVQRQLGLPAETMAWLGRVERPPDFEGPALPDDATADRLLERLGVDPADRAETLAARPDPHAHPALWWVLDRAYHELLATMGHGVPIDGFPGWPPLPAGAGTVGRHLYVWLYLAALPAARRYHTERGIADDVSWASLGDLGQALRAHRSATGTSGLGRFRLWDPPLRLRGAHYRLGRLEFSRGAISLSNGPCGWALDVHLPGGGTLDPAASEAAFAAARAFFPRHFPEEPVAVCTCSSWAMDPQIADYLPASANLVRFQRRFHLLPLTPQEAAQPDGDRAILGYVFGRLRQPDALGEVLNELPQDTTLQRAYVAHLRAGRHWHSRTGWALF